MSPDGDVLCLLNKKAPEFFEEAKQGVERAKGPMRFTSYVGQLLRWSPFTLVTLGENKTNKKTRVFRE
jgi:hypothetical protein